MAKLHTTGVEELLRSLDAYGARAEAAIPAMLTAGADVAQAAMEATTAWQDDTGQLRRSIKRTKVMGDGSGSYIDIYPSGKTPDGERLEEIGFVLEYGRGGNRPMAPRPWLRPAIEDNAAEILDAMQHEWEAGDYGG